MQHVTVPRATWDAMREALKLCYEHCRVYHPEVDTNNVGQSVRQALTAANAVSAEPLKVTDLGRYALEPQAQREIEEWFDANRMQKIGSLHHELVARFVAHSQATEPAGYKLVPVEPTREMLVALVCTGLRNTFYEEGRARFMEEMAQGYGAMLAAAPEAKQ